MEAWTLLLWAATQPIPHRGIDIQSEDACVIAAKSLTLNLLPKAVCINAFDGRTLYFTYGRQVEKF